MPTTSSLGSGSWPSNTSNGGDSQMFVPDLETDSQPSSLIHTSAGGSLTAISRCACRVSTK